MNHLKFFVNKTSRGLFIRLFLLLLPAIFLLSCTQEAARENNSHLLKEEAAPISSPEPTHSILPNLTPSSIQDSAQTSTLSSTATISLIDTSKVPEQARRLVQTLTKKDDAEQEWFSFPDGAMFHDIHIGDGKSIKKGVAVHTLLRGFLEDGTEFVNTMKNPMTKSYAFTVGHGDTLESFDRIISTMREKGKRVIVLPPELAYGDKEYRSPVIFIPPNSTLIFEASVMWIREPEWDKVNLFK